MSDIVHITIPMPYEVSLERAENTIAEICQEVKHHAHVSEYKYLSVNEFADSSVNYLIEGSCTPVNKLQVRRDALRSILDIMARNNISVPYTQIDVHEK